MDFVTYEIVLNNNFEKILNYFKIPNEVADIHRHRQNRRGIVTEPLCAYPDEERHAESNQD